MPASVLFVSQPTITGVGQCVYDWSTLLAARGWQVSVACPDDGWLRKRCADAGLRTFPWPAVRQPYRGVAREIRVLRDLIAEVAPDVVYLHGSKAGLSGRMLLRSRIPTAFSPHSWSFEAADGLIGRAALSWERAAARWTSSIICVSEAERQDGMARGIDANYVIARNGVDTRQIVAAEPAHRSALRAELGIQDADRVAVCVGRVHRQKGQDVLIDAWPLVRAARGRLYMVGDGPMLQEWSVRAAATCPDVAFVGGVEREGALKWMAAADVVVMPSRWEGMALIPLESLALGTPVIASDVTGAREAVGKSCGDLVPPENPIALAAALDSWLGRRPDELAAARVASRERIVGRFELAQTVDIIEETLDQAIAGRG